jgi:CheY-like chemotaxis protein
MLESVLIIDDSDADLLYTRLVIERSGGAREVQTFEQAQEALQALREGRLRPDLILLDINMPVMNGFEFLAALQAQVAELPTVPVVVMLTSSPDPADRARAEGFASVRGYLTKPIDREAATTLARFLSAVRP